MSPTLSDHNPSTAMLKITDTTKPSASACTPAASPTAMARKMYTASFVSLSVLRKRTAAASPARLNARARLFRTTATMPAIASGNRITVCTTDGSHRCRCLLSM